MNVGNFFHYAKTRIQSFDIKKSIIIMILLFPMTMLLNYIRILLSTDNMLYMFNESYNFVANYIFRGLAKDNSLIPVTLASLWFTVILFIITGCLGYYYLVNFIVENYVKKTQKQPEKIEKQQ